MKLIYLLSILLVISSCATEEDDYAPLQINQVLKENPEKVLKIDIIYVLPSGATESRKYYKLNAEDFIKNINGSFFNRYDIGFELGEISYINNNELYDLKDNRNEETSVFLRETQASFKKDRLNVYIMKRSNTIALAGIGKDCRVLVTDEHLYKTVTPHEIGHALGLFHHHEEGNIMSEIRPDLRREFTYEQVGTMKSRINEMANL